jgi:hypothetical protein
VVTARLAAPIVRALMLGMKFFMRNPFLDGSVVVGTRSLITLGVFELRR